MDDGDYGNANLCDVLVDYVLDDCFQLISLLFLTVGRNNEAPAVYVPFVRNEVDYTNIIVAVIQILSCDDCSGTCDRLSDTSPY